MTNSSNHTAPLSFDEWLAYKPANIRIGQHFINSYWEGESTEWSRIAYQLDGEQALNWLAIFMKNSQWDYWNMPEPRKYWEWNA